MQQRVAVAVLRAGEVRVAREVGEDGLRVVWDGVEKDVDGGCWGGRHCGIWSSRFLFFIFGLRNG